MRKLFASIGIAAALGTGALALNTVMPANASVSQDPSAEHHPVRRFVRNGVQVAAEAIGIPVADLRAALKDGQSIAEVAESHGVDPQVVIDALIADWTAKLPEAADRFVNHSR